MRLRGTQRNLKPKEISALESQGCSSDNWMDVWVSDTFETKYVHLVRFFGHIELGSFQKSHQLPGGLTQHTGLRNITLYNCSIGNDVLIENVHNYIANYDIGNSCYIRNVDAIWVEGTSYFGNNVSVSVLSEMGGHKVPIFNNLSASLAYIIALYQYQPYLIDKIKQLIDSYADRQASKRGRIGDNVIIVNVGSIINVRIGDCANLDSCTLLKNGSINSNEKAPVHIGADVIAQEFIISSGAVVANAAKILRCFIGQACYVLHSFSAHDSLLFSNCSFGNGEACSVFAGPFTVSTHKSSLLIAGMYSFLNAGSGSNQSNHMYKLGPIHHGIVERGSKMTSDSYILWPARVGAFSLVMGRHHHHSDTSDLPFSYLIEKNDETYLVPGVNLRSVGTIRDAQKWPRRDERTDPEQLDYINYNLLSPYTIQKMMKAVSILKNVQSLAGETSDAYYYQNARITGSSLKRGLILYDLAINKFLGNSLIKQLENTKFRSMAAVRRQLAPDIVWGDGEWLDLSGLILPKKLLDDLLLKVRIRVVDRLETFNHLFRQAHELYYAMEWKWAYDKIESYYGVELKSISAVQIVDIVKKWQESVVRLDEMLYEDAQKEFSPSFMTSFGVDGTDKEKKEDFENIRGSFENNPFVSAIKEHIHVKKELGNDLIARLERFL